MKAQRAGAAVRWGRRRGESALSGRPRTALHMDATACGCACIRYSRWAAKAESRSIPSDISRHSVTPAAIPATPKCETATTSRTAVDGRVVDVDARTVGQDEATNHRDNRGHHDVDRDRVRRP